MFGNGDQLPVVRFLLLLQIGTLTANVFPPGYAPVDLLPSSISIDLMRNITPAFSPPLRITYGAHDTVVLTNTGIELVAYANLQNTVHFVCDGLLGNNVYKFNRIRFAYNSSSRGTVDVTFNGQGTPLFIESFWYNIRYPCIEEAVRHRDGVFLLRIPVKVSGNVPNMQFLQFEMLLNTVRSASASVQTLYTNVYNWFKNSVRTNYYFFFETLYSYGQDEFNYATSVLTPLQAAESISTQQFNTFERLLNHDGGQLDGAASAGFIQAPPKIRRVSGSVNVTENPF